jgi:hAT family C-terminal dimerisation region
MEKSRQDREPDSECQDLLERDILSDDSESPDAQSDEFNSWQSLRPEKAVTNPIEYWKTNKHLWPRLARMAFDTLGVPAMSSEIERTFSDAGQIVSASQIGEIASIQRL